MIRVSSAATSGTARRTSSARKRDVAEVPDGRRDDVERPARRHLSAPRSPAGAAGRGSPRRSCAARASRSAGTWRLNSAPATIRSTRSTNRPLEADRDHLVDGPPLVDPPEQQPVELRVGEARLGLVGLARPQVGRRRLADDRLGHADRRRQLPDLALVQVADRVERARRVAEQRRVADQRLGLVAGPDDEAPPRDRAVVEHRHPHPRHEVAAPQRRRLEAVGAALASLPCGPK